MKVVLAVITFAAAALVVGSAPTLSEGQVHDYYRDTRSQYPQYVSPCAAAAASSPIPAMAPPAYELNIAPYHGYPLPPQYGYGMQYRSVETEPHEMMRYSDMDHIMSEHIPMARYGYSSPVAAHAAYVPIAAPAKTAPVFGVFPNANTGGCNVPLLFSCSPSVVSGHVVQSQAHYHPTAGSYRGVEPLAHQDSQEGHEELASAVHENLNAAQDPSHAMSHQ